MKYESLDRLPCAYREGPCLVIESPNGGDMTHREMTELVISLTNELAGTNLGELLDFLSLDELDGVSWEATPKELVGIIMAWVDANPNAERSQWSSSLKTVPWDQLWKPASREKYLPGIRLPRHDGQAVAASAYARIKSGKNLSIRHGL